MPKKKQPRSEQRFVAATTLDPERLDDATQVRLVAGVIKSFGSKPFSIGAILNRGRGKLRAYARSREVVRRAITRLRKERLVLIA